MPFPSRRRLVGRKPLLLAAATAVGATSLIAPTSANAVLGPVGPGNAPPGFPTYVSDTAGTRLDLCLDSPFCLGARADLTAPDGEAFWWNSEATMPTSGGSALMVLAVEAADGGGTPGAAHGLHPGGLPHPPPEGGADPGGLPPRAGEDKG